MLHTHTTLPVRPIISMCTEVQPVLFLKSLPSVSKCYKTFQVKRHVFWVSGFIITNIPVQVFPSPCIFDNSFLLKCKKIICLNSCPEMFALTVHYINNVYQTILTYVHFCTATENITIPKMAIYNPALYSNIEESHMTSCHISLSIQSCRMWMAAF